MIEYLIAFLVLVCSYPAAMLLHKLTKDEKNIYGEYFPAFLWILAILTAVFLAINIQISFSTGFLFLTIFFWNRF